MNSRRWTSVVTALLMASVVAGCSDSPAADPVGGATTSSTPSASSTSTPSSAPSSTPPTSSATPAGTGCSTAGPEPAAGAVLGAAGDVDGDGRADEAWLAPGEDGAVTVGIRTAAGGSSTASVTLSGPSARSLLVADADGDGRVELFVSDGRTVDLYAVDGCAVQPVLNGEGQDYRFDLGFRGNGTGVGCVEVDGARHLVGLDRTGGSASEVTWTRTVVELDGLRARNGATDSGTYALPRQQAQADLLSQVSCGDLTLASDGIVLPG